MPIWVYQHMPVMVFVFAFGAIVGSFINVVIYRLPAGMSVEEARELAAALRAPPGPGATPE